ncbi:PAS domain S-box protein [uncultured Methanoregula sp.]|uniref:PAS domain S-box protein n=1 Tax=uncultured Methanoregula sp. TaxID=1005933 RepID=UPI002AABAF14|nr:PAS domain S-box protein [uncultured Methanoregula sp.]
MIPKTPRFFSTILFILIVLITVVTVYSISTQTQQALKGAVQEKLMAVASTTASQIDGDTFARIRPGEEGSRDFTGIRDQLRSVKMANGDTRFIYTLRKNGNSVEFVVDGDYGYAPDAATIGLAYPEAEPELFLGFTAPAADKEFTTDPWGTVLSGFAPIHDHAGNVVGIVGVDMDSSVVSAELSFLNIVLYGIGIIALVSAVIGIIVIERRRTADEQKIAESEKKYRLLFERAGDAIFLLDSEAKSMGSIISANQAAAAIHGYTIDELEGMNITDLMTPEAKDGAPEQFSQIIHGVWLHGEINHRKKNGAAFPVEFSAGLLDLGIKKYMLVFIHDISERKKADNALQQVTKKLSLLNSVTFNDIRNVVFTLNGYITLGKTFPENEKVYQTLDKAEDSVRRLTRSIDFAKNYQDLGAKPPRWLDVNQTFIFGISHLDFSRIHRSVNLNGLEIYADSLLERVFVSLADNVLRHAEGATLVTLGYRMDGSDLILFFEDNGVGIPETIKEKIFERGYGSEKGMGLFLAREILSITGLSIRETGTTGKGAMFEIIVPREMYRFSPENKP